MQCVAREELPQVWRIAFLIFSIPPEHLLFRPVGTVWCQMSLPLRYIVSDKKANGGVDISTRMNTAAFLRNSSNRGGIQYMNICDRNLHVSTNATIFAVQVMEWVPEMWLGRRIRLVSNSPRSLI